MARRRLVLLGSLGRLEAAEEVNRLAKAIMAKVPIPLKASEDAAHIAMATVHRMDFLLTWNCRHIANADIQRMVRRVCLDLGWQMPLICTPAELFYPLP